MAEIIASLTPGRYPTGQTLTVKFPPGTRKAIVTRTDKAPVLTEVLAYDTGPITPNPPPSQGGTGPIGPSIERPFLVVTQDGRGNVVYDGGFPKFYNLELKKGTPNWPSAPPTTFAELTGASKYLYNAFNFCANKRKIANGNRKVLFINNADKNYDYYMMGSHYNPYPGQGEVNGDYGFKDTFDALCNIGGWEPTYYVYTGSMIDLSYDELDKYTHIVFLSSWGSNGVVRITDNFANNVALYRTAGNGVIIITDHTNFNFTSVEDALARGDGFVPDANKLAAKYDCYFSGNVDRLPVQVGEIRRQIGLPGPPENHPLLDNLSDSEYIFAGGSESVIFPKIYTDEVVPDDQDLVVNMTTAGTYYINVLVQLDSGDILTKPMRFVIIDPSTYVMRNSVQRDVGATDDTYKRVFDYSFVNTINGTETLRGEILRDGIIQGYFLLENNVMSNYPFSGAAISIGHTTVAGFNIMQPFEFLVKTTVQTVGRVDLYSKSGSISTFLGELTKQPMYQGISTRVAFDDIIRTGNNAYLPPAQRGRNTKYNWFEEMYRARACVDEGSSLAQCNMYVAPDPVSWTATKPPSPIGAAAIIASTNEVYYFCESCLDWRLHIQKANDLFGLLRIVVDPYSGQTWRINVANTTKVT